MRWEEILELQREFELNFFDPEEMTYEEREQWIKEFVLHIHDQTNSLLRELNWKTHRPYHPVEYDNVMCELVDIQKYVLAIHAVLNTDPVEFRERFYERSAEVEKRFEDEMK